MVPKYLEGLGGWVREVSRAEKIGDGVESRSAGINSPVVYRMWKGCEGGI